MKSIESLLEAQEKSRVLAGKIEKEIRYYQLRKLVAQDSFSNVSRLIKLHHQSWEMVREWKMQLSALQDEIDLCLRQIDAYKTNNNKMKLIPDKLL